LALSGVPLRDRGSIEALIACALPPGSPEISHRIQAAFRTDFDLAKLRELARYHRVDPVLCLRIITYAADSFTGPIIAGLREDLRVRTARNLAAAGELIGVMRRFHSAGIPALPHKGPLLALIAYRDLGLRSFDDLDLLVRDADLPRALSLLEECGYTREPALAWLSPDALQRWTGEVSCHPASGHPIDLHWKLTPPHYILQLDPKMLWSHTATVSLAGFGITTIAPEALFLFLSVHGAKHCWEAIGWLADLAWLLDSAPQFDWELTQRLAAESHCERPLHLAASLIADVFGSTVGIVQDSTLDALHRRVIDRWYSAPAETPRSPELLSFAAGLARRKSDLLTHLYGLLFHPTEIDWRAHRLPERLFFLYGPARALRLAGKYLFRARNPAAKTIQ
jgi:hypothetical protein